MPSEDLILSALSNIQQDIREIRESQKEQGDKISDLCTRTSLTDQTVRTEISNRVKSETSKYKFITIAFTFIGGIITAFTSLKQANIIH
jgi:hypothetical protein